MRFGSHPPLTSAAGLSSAQWVGSLPEVPILSESGLPRLGELAVGPWAGLLAPALTPPAVLARFIAERHAVQADPAVREGLGVVGIEPTSGTPDPLRQQMSRDLAAHGAIVKGAGIQVD